MKLVRRSGGLGVSSLLLAVALSAQDTSGVKARNDSLTVRFVDADLRGVIQALGRYLAKPVLVGTLQPARVSFETPGPVPRSAVGTLLKGIVESQNLQFSEDSTFFRVGPRPLEAADRLTAQLPDRRGQGGGAQGDVRLFVIRLKHARAADVAATVNLLFGAGGEFSGRPGLATPTLSDELRRNVVPPQGAAPPTQAAGAAAPGARPATLTGAVTIVPDPLTNSLLIRASEVDFAVLQEAVEQLDIRPLPATTGRSPSVRTSFSPRSPSTGEPALSTRHRPAAGSATWSFA